MGGKSTLLRSTCVAVIMAQLGCCVPASRAVLEPVDAIFTRIGEQRAAVACFLCTAAGRLTAPMWAVCPATRGDFRTSIYPELSAQRRGLHQHCTLSIR